MLRFASYSEIIAIRKQVVSLKFSSTIIIIIIYNNNDISIIIDNTIKKPKSTEVHKVKISIDFHENKCF